MIRTYEQFVNENLSLNKEQIEKALALIQSKIPFKKLTNIIKKNKDKILFFIKKYTNGKDTIYTEKILHTNEGFKDSAFYEFFIEIFTEGFGGIVMGGLIWILSLLGAFLIYLLGVYLYMNLIYKPFDSGVVQKTEFIPARTNIVTTYIHVGKSMVPIINTIHVPDTYEVTIKDINSDKIEKWSTTDMDQKENLIKGDTISWDEAVFSIYQMK
jgi:hypothetical protein